MKAPNKFLHNNEETYASLNDFTDAIEALPMDLTRNFTLLREVDAKVSSLQHLISSSISNLLTNTNSFQETKSISSSKLQSLLIQIIPYADEKISLASSTRDAVKKHLKRLDLDFSLIENEIPAIIRLGSTSHPAFSSNSNISRSETRKETIATRRTTTEELNIPNNSRGNHRENSTPIRKKRISHINGGATSPRFDTPDKDKKKGGTYEKIKSRDQNQQSQFQLRREPIKKKFKSRFITFYYIMFKINILIYPNEPTYCYCDQVSYGEMVACDGKKCHREWFHLPCIGLPEPPQGEWYCDECALEKQSKGRRPRRKIG
ncbi:uncharacterized protein T551_02760 [Pneumocystis jirovecii RU7]|uniref:Chromatin modification-related protein n=1 Tax=Pneumocystis jirovecii (strain RU7) TaxID=1408657 RepID=A0A0W4ZIZ6_PNEJ7|nr:uncharacterized protein T551_02760 [Pneumocystis jirovecii RU7]KTW28341.1 hypothetical protein T551_02760 [Pneumocystis jirovecii RU7]